MPPQKGDNDFFSSIRKRPWADGNQFFRLTAPASGENASDVSAQPQPLSQFNGPAADRAREYGIDLSLLAENLKLTPAERLEAHDQALAVQLALQAAVKKADASTS